MAALWCQGLAGVGTSPVCRARFFDDERLREAAQTAAIGCLALAPRLVTQLHAIFAPTYERRGDRVLKLLGQELFDDTFRERMDLGRRLHREQIAELFAPQLTERPTADYEALIDLLVVATDVYTWKLLRRDRRLDRPHRRGTDAAAHRRHPPSHHRRSLIMANILFVTWDGGGNLPPALGIATELQRRGDTVRFLGHAQQRNVIENGGLRSSLLAPAGVFRENGGELGSPDHILVGFHGRSKHWVRHAGTRAAGSRPTWS